MKKLFPVALCFFLLAAAANLAGQVWMGELARMSKPALLPLLALVTLLGLPEESRERTCLLTAQLLGFLGDVLLMKDGLPWFGSGIAAFLTGHIFYIRFFGGRSWKGLGWKAWAIGIPVMAALVAGLVRAIGIQGALLIPMTVYGSVLMLLIFSALCGVIREGGRAWWLLLMGAVLFTFSDSLIAMHTFGVENWTLHGLAVMGTYITAQVLLAAGGGALIRK